MVLINLQGTAKINKGNILDPWCAEASPKPKLIGGDRRILKENFEDDSVPEFYCSVFLLSPPSLSFVKRLQIRLVLKFLRLSIY